jgi:hypothetical protein
MSRAYRIRVRESLARVVRGRDQVATELELLEILPRQQMAELLGQQLAERGYRRDGRTAIRDHDGIRVEVELDTGAVRVRAESSREVNLEGEKEGRAFDDMGPHAGKVARNLRQALREDLEKKAEEHAGRLQTEVTDRLERELIDLRQELNQAVNRATAEALKRKAAQLGQIRQITEDAEAGSLTIVLEV